MATSAANAAPVVDTLEGIAESRLKIIDSKYNASHDVSNPADLIATQANRSARIFDPCLRASRLRKRIELQFQLSDEYIELGSVRLPFVRVADPDAVLDQICEQESLQQSAAPEHRKELRMPYWAAVWESAIGFGRWLSARPGLLHAKRVLDLGCGMGMAGMIAAYHGAQVVLVDYEPACLGLAALNTLAWRGQTRVQRLDWNRDRISPGFEVIIASDVLYERDQWGPLERFWKNHMSRGGTIIIGEPGRPRADGFPDFATSLGWRCEVSTQVIENYARPIRIFTLSIS